MRRELTEKIMAAETVEAYEVAVKALAEYLINAGEPEKAQNLMEIASVRKNRFSKREEAEVLSAGKAAVVEYCQMLRVCADSVSGDAIAPVLENFHYFCRNLYRTKMHEKCSNGVKEHLTGFYIENEYDLQRLMLAVLSAVFPDARTESVQDSGHHAVRKDIVVDSQSAVIELKCTHRGSIERQISEEIASDMVHYNCDRLYFYILDKAGVIKNPLSFKRAYEKKRIDDRSVRVIIYEHSDI